MRFEPEVSDGANAGLPIIHDMLKPVKDKNPDVSVADIWALAGACGVEFAGGPKIPFAFGRTDAENKSPPACPAHAVPENNRLPDAAQGAEHLRQVFGRMGFNDREIVALSGGHTLGRSHAVRSGFDGPWTHDPLTFNNAYFKELMYNEWVVRSWDGNMQFEDATTRSLMMLPTDIALKTDPVFGPVAREYAENQEVFFKDFAAAYSKLLHLGCANQPAELPTPTVRERAGIEFREHAMHGSTKRMKEVAGAANVHEQEPNSGRTALHKAALWGHVETIACLLYELKLDPNVADFSGDTALHEAARYGHKGVIDKLLAAGADPNKVNNDGKTCADLVEDYGLDPIDGPRLTLEQLSALDAQAFEATLGGVYESAAWVARDVAAKRPFDSIRSLAKAMAAAVDGADEAAKVALLKAQPARGAFERCTLGEIEQLSALTREYDEKFGWPLTLAVHNSTKNTVLTAIQRRLKNDSRTERAESLEQVHKIAYARLLGAVEHAPTGSLTCHVLDEVRGCPAAGLHLTLRCLNGSKARTLGRWITNEDGCLPDGPALKGARHKAGTYEWTFSVGEYFAAAGVPMNIGTPFLDEIPVRFGIGDPESHTHMPLLVSPAGCSMHRKSRL
eukprot:NODE_1798_length_2371_cov_9.468806.p1 GENE.NODE_1798_length_2371_cov_9.468806~~NODE_1798_length_2371_cov_9.468806.p1  ORF type:complete len:661 (+),score=99.06 NODE_1798_length_2371_cov_9.468806:126-1985(+)